MVGVGAMFSTRAVLLCSITPPTAVGRPLYSSYKCVGELRVMVIGLLSVVSKPVGFPSAFHVPASGAWRLRSGRIVAHK